MIHKQHRNARGIALLAGLVLMAAISLLAMTATSSMILQRRMAANFQDQQQSLSAASRANQWAIAWLNSRPNDEREQGCAADCLLPPAIRNEGELPAQPEFESDSWWLSSGISTGADPGSDENPPDQPDGQWLIEEIHYESLDEAESESTGPEGIAYYRILSRGQGRQASSVAVSESIVARPWGGEFVPGPFPPSRGPNTFCQQFAQDTACGRLAWRQRR